MDNLPARHDLSERIRVFIGRLYNHDYLWFSSSEISKVSTTLPYLHNYALSYALDQFERSVVIGNVPTYDADLRQMSLYATPAASPSVIETTILTFNAVDAKTLRTDLKYRRNAPDYGKRIYLNPIYSDSSEKRRSGGYLFYLFSYDGMHPRSIVRLGKKGCPIRIDWEEIKQPIAFFSDTPVRPTHPVNPLDVAGEIKRFEPIMIPPHLLLRIADIKGDYFIRSGFHLIHVPKRVMERVESGEMSK